MESMLIYLGAAAIGYLIGNRLKKLDRHISWSGKVQTVVIIGLIFTMGLRMGANKQVVENLNSIGLYALIITIITMTCSVVAISLARRLIGLDHYGRKKSNTGQKIKKQSKDTEDSGQGYKMTRLILIFVVVGMSSGYVFVDKLFTNIKTFETMSGYTITVGLCILLFFVGIDLSISGTIIQSIKDVGLKVLIFPLAIAVGTLIGTLISLIFVPITAREALAIGAGFGWYTLAPGIIIESGNITAGAISFMHNIMREMLSILLIPFIASKFGYIEVTGLGGSSNMDVCLPLIEKSTQSDIAVYAIITGVLLSLSTPILVPLFIG
ncbi:MAG: lysine exporter LysO family protein [Peptostreptococcaceae bacterium]|nr:lysine exporter LysO family protein [Peptostreptococcaceae bacterium]